MSLRLVTTMITLTCIVFSTATAVHASGSEMQTEHSTRRRLMSFSSAFSFLARIVSRLLFWWPGCNYTPPRRERRRRTRRTPLHELHAASQEAVPFVRGRVLQCEEDNSGEWTPYAEWYNVNRDSYEDKLPSEEDVLRDLKKEKRQLGKDNIEDVTVTWSSWCIKTGKRLKLTFRVVIDKTICRKVKECPKKIVKGIKKCCKQCGYRTAKLTKTDNMEKCGRYTCIACGVVGCCAAVGPGLVCAGPVCCAAAGTYVAAPACSCTAAWGCKEYRKSRREEAFKKWDGTKPFEDPVCLGNHCS